MYTVGPCGGQALPPPPLYPPFVSKSLIRDTKGAGGRGEGLLLVISCLLRSDREFSHGSDLSNMPALPVIFDGSPFFGENTPVVAPESEMSRPTTTELGGWGRDGGGYQGEEMKQAGGGGGRRENACVVFWSTSSLKKNYKAVTLESHPHLFWVIAIINTLVIRSSLKDGQSMKKECILARHTAYIFNSA